MRASEKTLIVLGGSGFIGRRVIEQAVRAGWQVKALVRSAPSAAIVTAAGASVLTGEVNNPAPWLADIKGADAIIDLVQPARAKRLGRSQMRRLSQQRQNFTRVLTAALRTLSTDQRPHLVSVSGIDDLAPDSNGYLSAQSALAAKESGFNTIGVPVRKIIEQAGIVASFAYLASVYGPGGPFGETIFPAVAAGKWKNFGDGADRMILIHVDDAASGLVQIVGLDLAQVAGKSFVLTDRGPVTMASFAGLAAKLLGVAAPGKVPKWMAALFAGKPVIETTLHKESTQPSFAALPNWHLTYPTYLEGLPASLRALGIMRG